MDMYTNNHSSANIDIYTGNSGRCLAVVRFLKLALSINTPVKLLLTSQEDISWMLEDKSFLAEWNNLLHQVLEKGHKIIIVHSFDRSMSKLLSIMNYWIPLHLTGKIEGYCYNSYTHNTPKYTIFALEAAAEDTACIFSYTSENTSQNYISFYFTQPDIIAHYKQIFLSLLENCTPIIKVLNNEPLQLFNKLAYLENKWGTFFALYKKMRGILMPVPLYKRIITRLDISISEQKNRIGLYQKNNPPIKGIRTMMSLPFSLSFRMFCRMS